MSEYVTWQRRISVIDFILFTYLQVSESVQATVSLRAWQDDGTGWHIRLVQWPSARVKTLLQLLTLSPGRPRFGHSWVSMEFVVDKVALRQVFLQELRSPLLPHPHTNSTQLFLRPSPTLRCFSIWLRPWIKRRSVTLSLSGCVTQDIQCSAFQLCPADTWKPHRDCKCSGNPRAVREQATCGTERRLEVSECQSLEDAQQHVTAQILSAE